MKGVALLFGAVAVALGASGWAHSVRVSSGSVDELRDTFLATDSRGVVVRLADVGMP